MAVEEEPVALFDGVARLWSQFARTATEAVLVLTISIGVPAVLFEHLRSTLALTGVA